MSEYIVKGAEPNETVLHRRTSNGYDEWSWLPVREEIVRCRDCKYSSAGEAVISGNWKLGSCHNPRFRGSIQAANVTADGFCAWSERGDAE